jgi:hypothetical protein
LPVDRAQVVLASPIHIEKINKVFPPLIKALNVMRDLLSARKFFVVRVDLVLHPAKVLNCFSLSGIELFD